MLSDARLRGIAGRFVEVPGVAGVMLGGSRAWGTEQPDSDVDLGLYYRPPLAGRRRAAPRDGGTLSGVLTQEVDDDRGEQRRGEDVVVRQARQHGQRVPALRPALTHPAAVPQTAT